jgi:hypothetical protein
LPICPTTTPNPCHPAARACWSPNADKYGCGKDLPETLNHSVGCRLPSLRGQMLRRGRRQRLDCPPSYSPRGEADQRRSNSTFMALFDLKRVCSLPSGGIERLYRSMRALAHAGSHQNASSSIEGKPFLALQCRTALPLRCAMEYGTIGR